MWGKIEGKRRGQKLRWLDSITSSLEVNVSKTLRDSGGQGSLVCCSPWDYKESDMTATEQQNLRFAYWPKFLAESFPHNIHLHQHQSQGKFICICLGLGQDCMGLFRSFLPGRIAL